MPEDLSKYGEPAGDLSLYGEPADELPSDAKLIPQGMLPSYKSPEEAAQARFQLENDLALNLHGETDPNAGTFKGVWQNLNTPLLKLPGADLGTRYPGGTRLEVNPLEAVLTGLYTGAVKPMTEAIVSPLGIATLGGASAVPGLGRLAAGGFAALGAANVPEVYARSKETLNSPDLTLGQGTEAAAELLMSLALPTIGLKYALGNTVAGRPSYNQVPFDEFQRAPWRSGEVVDLGPVPKKQLLLPPPPRELPGPTVGNPTPPPEIPPPPAPRSRIINGRLYSNPLDPDLIRQALGTAKQELAPAARAVGEVVKEGAPAVAPLAALQVGENRLVRNPPTQAEEALARALSMDVDLYPVGRQQWNEAQGRGEPTTRKQANLGELTQNRPVYHETSLDNAYSVYDGLRRPFRGSWSRFFVSDNLDLALGQGGRGVTFELDPTRLNGLRHNQLGTSPETGSEYTVDRSVQGAVQAVIFANQRQVAAFQRRFPNGLDYAAAAPADRGIVHGQGIRVPVKRAQPKAEPPVSQRLSTFGLFDPELYTEAAKTAGRAVADVTRAYAEPLREALGRAGGPVSKKVSEELGQIVADEKQLMGDLAPTLDPAKLATNKPDSANLWLRRLNNVTEHTAFNNAFGVNEGDFPAAPVARKAYNAVDFSNWNIGRLAMQASPDFVPNRKFQRILTPVAVDFIREGGVPMRRWAEGLAARNANTLARHGLIPANSIAVLGQPSPAMRFVLNMMAQMKAALDKAKDDGGASFERISQDFVRLLPKTITHVRHGGAWHEVVVADPFRYLEAAARKTARAVAFRRVYPLVRDPMTGKWVSSGLFERTREAVMRELPTDRERTTFDDVFNTLAGHTLDPFNRGWNRASAVVNVAQGPLKALQLTLNAPVNLAELVFGGPAIFFRINRLLPAMARLGLALYQQLEQVGAVDKAIQNFSFDPSAPMRSTSRIAANAIRKWTGQQIVNELQELQAAAVAQYVANAVRTGRINGQELVEFETTLRAMGFTRAQAARGIAGDNEVLRQFVSRAAPFLTAGNMAPVEMSRLGVARWFNFWFPYHRYSMMAANQLRKVTANLYNDITDMASGPSRAKWNRIRAGAKLLAKQIAFRGLQGYFTKAILAIAGAWVYGLAQQRQETEDSPGKMAVDSLAAGYGGPLAIIKKVAADSSDAKGLVIGAAQTSGTFNWMSELLEMGLNSGAYAGKNLDEKLATFLQKQTPGSRIVHTAIAVSGLAEADQELDAAMIAFRRWRKEQPGYAPRTSSGGEADEKQTREQIRKVVVAIEQGKDWRAELEKLTDYKHAANAIRAKSLLNVDGSPLTPEQMKSLESRIGKKAVARIQTRDAMLHEIARYITKARSTKGIAEPTGRFAEDLERESTRTERIKSKLDPAVAELFASAGLDPSLEAKGYGKTDKVDRSLTMKQAGKAEESYVQLLNRSFANAVTNANFRKTWSASSQEQKAAFLKTQVEQIREAARYSLRKPAN